MAHPADAVLRRFFRERPALGRRERGFVAETVFAMLRHHGWLEHFGAASIERKVLASAARLCGEPLDRLSTTDADREWVEALPHFADDPALPFAVRAELPDWVITALRAHHDDEAILALGRAMQAPAPLDLRVNPLRCTRDEAIAALASRSIEGRPTPLSPFGIRVAGKPALERDPLYLDGSIEVQDEGSQLIGLLLAPRRRELVVDFCAGAGGKTLLLGALMRSEGRLYAFDVAEARLARLRERVARAGLSNVQVVRLVHERDPHVKRLAGKIDRVLVDAPCTGLGTLRRNPDLKWRQSPQTLATLTVQQAAILAAAATLLRPGGRLVYATCSLLAAENEAVVDAFLAAHAGFARLDCTALLAPQGVIVPGGPDLHLDPHTHGTDGFYAAVLERSR